MIRSRNGEKPAVQPKPFFDIRRGDTKAMFDVSLTIKLNPLMTEQLVDLFDDMVDAGISIPPEAWAFFKQLESWAGEKE